MKYKVQREWLNITIDKKTPYKTLKEFFDYYHISKKNRNLMLSSEEVMINHLVITDENTPLTSGKQYSASVGKLATARETQTSNCSLRIDAKSSAR